MSPFLAELIGTMLLIILGDGVVANVVLHKTKGHNSGWIVIATGWGLAVAVAVYCVASVSGAHINPIRRSRLVWPRLESFPGAWCRDIFWRRFWARRWEAWWSGWLICRTGKKRPILRRNWRFSPPVPRFETRWETSFAKPSEHLFWFLGYWPLHRRAIWCPVPSSKKDLARCWPARWSGQLVFLSAARPATRSIPPAISVRASRTFFYRLRERGVPNGDMRGFPSSVPSWEVFWAHCSTRFCLTRHEFRPR